MGDVLASYHAADELVLLQVSFSMAVVEQRDFPVFFFSSPETCHMSIVMKSGL